MREEAATLYYESRVTIDPVTDEARHATLERVAYTHGYHVAKLVMHKGPVKDSFMTARGTRYADTVRALQALVKDLNAEGFVVRRYKIEDTVLDSNRQDELRLLQ